jgi:HAD superfamily hydrolase (TIGR01490 family)
LEDKKLENSLSTVAIFDLDYTLLEGDSESLWSHFLFEQGLVGSDFVARIETYYHDYEMGQLDIYEYEEFLLHPLTLFSFDVLFNLRKEYLKRISQFIRQQMVERVKWHQAQGHILLMVTASNSFIAEPLADLLGFPNLICTFVEKDGDRFTGKLTGIPAFRVGKLLRLEIWLYQHGLTLTNSWGYSDSHNDLPILELVDNPVAVSPDSFLKAHAHRNGWEVILIS